MNTEPLHSFYALTPERILIAVERLGFRCTGRSLALNSMENRVYEVEIELPAGQEAQSRFDMFRVVKFYRPGRWTKDQILEEHRFLHDLKAADIPVIAPEQNEHGETILLDEETGMFFSVFPKFGGRAPDELTNEQAERIGRLIARLHTVGASHDAPHRLRLTPQTYGLDNLRFLLQGNFLPKEIAPLYKNLVEQLCSTVAPWFEGVQSHRIHGDCHFSNILWGAEGPFLLDFDDMVVGPAVQDLWLLIPGRDEESSRVLSVMLSGYEQMRHFDRSTLRLIEPLRALRLIHYSAWIAKRWEDPAFQRAFPHFKTPSYWSEQVGDLRDQLGALHEGHWAVS